MTADYITLRETFHLCSGPQETYFHAKSGCTDPMQRVEEFVDQHLFDDWPEAELIKIREAWEHPETGELSPGGKITIHYRENRGTGRG